jgi:hypothetical protein
VFKRLFGSKEPTPSVAASPLDYEQLQAVPLEQLIELLERRMRSPPAVTVSEMQAVSRRLLDIVFLDEGVAATDRARAEELEKVVSAEVEKTLAGDGKALELRRDARNLHIKQGRQLGVQSLAYKIGHIDPSTTATGNNSSGFGRQYCAYHSSTTSSYGDIAYTNLPYITDAGASCGANFNGLGALAGITIVEGHEAAETITDQFPSTGWLDSGGAENGDKCAWITSGQGAAANVTFTSGTFPVQSLWSNASNNDAGGCVLSYP